MISSDTNIYKGRGTLFSISFFCPNKSRKQRKLNVLGTAVSLWAECGGKEFIHSAKCRAGLVVGGQQIGWTS